MRTKGVLGSFSLRFRDSLGLQTTHTNIQTYKHIKTHKQRWMTTTRLKTKRPKHTTDKVIAGTRSISSHQKALNAGFNHHGGKAHLRHTLDAASHLESFLR